MKKTAVWAVLHHSVLVRREERIDTSTHSSSGFFAADDDRDDDEEIGDPFYPRLLGRWEDPEAWPSSSERMLLVVRTGTGSRRLHFFFF